jgi:excisionase family DNA binding protein
VGGEVAEETESFRGETVNGKLWDVNEVAEYLGWVPGTVYQRLSRREIPCVRLSARCVRFEPEVIAAWVAQQSETPEGFNYPRKEMLNDAGERRGKKQKAA